MGFTRIWASRDQIFRRRHMLLERRGGRLELGLYGVPNIFGDLHARRAGIDNEATLWLVGGERAERLAEFFVKFNVFRFEPIRGGVAAAQRQTLQGHIDGQVEDERE